MNKNNNTNRTKYTDKDIYYYKQHIIPHRRIYSNTKNDYYPLNNKFKKPSQSQKKDVELCCCIIL